MPETLFGRIVVPIATEDDARTTCETARPTPPGREREAYIVHVIEKAGSALDKASVEQREQVAERVFRTASNTFEAAGFTDFETRLLYGTDVATTILDVCDELDG